MVGRTRSEDLLPPGFRFHPTDEELIMYYLRNQATSKPCPVSIIPRVDIAKAEFGDKEWYFFSPRDRKYRNGVRPNRAAVSGYWKATGTDKGICSGSKHVGVKKALVFYKGKPPKGIKTDWIMHEYRLSNTESRPHPNNQNGSMRLDDWVLCRIYKKKNVMRSPELRFEESSFAQIVNTNETMYEQQQGYKFPRSASLTHLWELDYMVSISQLMDENAYTRPFNNEAVTISDNGDCKYQQGQVQMQNTDPIKFQVNHHHQPFFVNPTV